MPSLVSLACCEDINAQRQALAALRSICISPEFRAVVVREGILDPLVLMSRSEDNDILREVSAGLSFNTDFLLVLIRIISFLYR